MTRTITLRLNRVFDPDRRITAIKALRDVAVPTEPGLSKIGLKEAKEVVDDVAGYRPGIGQTDRITPRTVEVAADADLYDLASTFDFNEVVPDEAFSTDIPRGLVVDLILDAMACMTVEQAQAFRAMPAYRDVRDRLA